MGMQNIEILNIISPKRADCERMNMYYENKPRPVVGSPLSLGARLSRFTIFPGQILGVLAGIWQLSRGAHKWLLNCKYQGRILCF